MAPECLSGKAYNMKADVYSLAIILWEILSGKTPFGFVKKRQELIRRVVDEHDRPAIDDNWPSAVQGMLESSFDSEIEKRPVSASTCQSRQKTFLSIFILIFCLPSCINKDNGVVVYNHL